jgi:hypothetical protein
MKHKNIILDSCGRLGRLFSVKTDSSSGSRLTPCQFRDIKTGKPLSMDCPICRELLIDKKEK